jgi:F-type H+-transporting ATPase subunit b
MLDISPALVIITAVIFLVTLVLLNKWLYQPLIQHMDDRKNSIDRDLKNANMNSSNVDELITQANDIIAKAKSKANAIREEAITEAQSLAKAKISQKSLELESEYNNFMTFLEDEKAKLREVLSKDIPVYKKAIQSKIANI